MSINTTASEEVLMINGKRYVLESVQDDLVIEPWEPEGGSFYVTSEGYIAQAGSTNRCKSFGMERPCRKQAKDAADMMRSYLRLLAYRHEFCPEWDENWLTQQEQHWYIYYDFKLSRYERSSVKWQRGVGQVYFPLLVAEELVDKLNRGEVVL